MDGRAWTKAESQGSVGTCGASLYWTESGFRKELGRSAARFMESRSVALDPIAAAPDAQMRELVDDFLAAQRSPGTRAS